MGHRLREGTLPRYITSHLGQQLSLLLFVGREMSTDQGTMMRCGWGV